MIQNLMNMDSDPKLREAWNRVPFKVQVAFIVRSQVEDVNLFFNANREWEILSAEKFQKVMKKEERLRKKAAKKAKKEAPAEEKKPVEAPIEKPVETPEVKPE